MVMDN